MARATRALFLSAALLLPLHSGVKAKSLDFVFQLNSRTKAVELKKRAQCENVGPPPVCFLFVRLVWGCVPPSCPLQPSPVLSGYRGEDSALTFDTCGRWQGP